jgi:AraC family transcriptional regulator, transcriptional activator of pobA
MNLSIPPPATSLAYQISGQKIQFQSIACALTNREWTLDADRNRSPTHAILLKAGQGHLVLPHDRLDFAAPAVLWLPPRTAERLHVKAGGAGFLLAISDEILANTTGSGAEAIALAAVADRMLIAPIESEGTRRDLDHSFSAIEREISRIEHGSSTVVAAHIVLIMVGLWRTSGIEEIASQSRGASSSVLQKFRYLVELHFRDHWPIQKYADALAISTDRLHSMCVRELNRPPLKLIHERLVREAMLLLEKSMLTIEQISNHLKFKDPAHFNRFFKTNAGVPPGSFRREMSHLAAHSNARQKHHSYADWP